MAKNLRCDLEFCKSVRGNSGVMYSARIGVGNRTGLEEGVANGTLIKLGALEAGEREIRVAEKPVADELPAIVVRGEVNYDEDTKAAGLWGKFRNNVANPLPVAQLSVGDFIGLSEDFFPAGDIEAIKVGDKYVINAGFVAGDQLVKNPAPSTGDVVFEVVEVKANHIPVYLLGDGNMTKPYKMISVEVKIAE